MGSLRGTIRPVRTRISIVEGSVLEVNLNGRIAVRESAQKSIQILDSPGNQP